MLGLGRRFREDRRALSSAFAQVLLFLVIIMVVAVLANYVMSSLPTRQVPQLQLAVDGKEGNITITHMGGDAVSYADIAVIVYGENGGVVKQVEGKDVAKEQITTISGYSDQMFENGESIAIPVTSGTYKVAMLFKPLSKTIVTKNVYVS